MFTFSPLQGALSEATASQSLLELDGGVKVLIDIGWDETFDVEKLKELEKQVPTLSLILLTHATVPHLSALVHCCKNFPLFARIPIYATQPVIDLGRTLIQDLYLSTPAAATTIAHSTLAEASYSFSHSDAAGHNFLLQAPTPDEIAKYFSLIQPLKYSQPHQPLASPFSPPLNGLTVTAYNAGHSLGGTIWHIQHGMESIVYAVDWNLARDNVYAGAAWMGGGHGDGGAEVIEQLRKPTALVCSARAAEGGLTRAARDQQLLDTMRLAVSKGGTVLIPVDSSARVLELAYLLEHAWRQEAGSDDGGLSAAKLYLAGRSVNSTIKLAKSMFEWMDNSIVQEFEAGADQGFRKTNGNTDAKGKDGGPFDFKYLRLLDRKAQIDKVLDPSAPEQKAKVILASDTSLEWGFSKDIIESIASDPKNLVILPEKPAENSRSRPSIARQLWQWWKERKHGVADDDSSGHGSAEQVLAGGQTLEIVRPKKVALSDAELSVYQQWLATQRQLNATIQGGGASTLETAADAADDVSDSSSDSDDDSENEQQGKVLNASTTQASRKKVVLQDEDLGVMILLKKPGVYDFAVKGKKGRERMFPLTVRRKRNDDYGELIRPEDYLRAEEREENERPDTQQPQGSEDQDGFGQKRRWDDAGSRNSARGPRRRGQRGQADDADAAQAASEAPLDELDLVEDVEEEAVTGPAKLVQETSTIAVNLRLALVDFSGLHDRRSLAMLIPLIQPRKLILVAGSVDETEAVADDCRRNAIEVFTPPVGATVDASVDTNAWVVKLADPLVKRLKWQQVRGLGIVTVTAQLTATPAAQKNGVPLLVLEDGANKRQKIKASEGDADGDQGSAGQDDDVAVMPTLDILPAALVSASRSAAQVLHVGELRLADLRRTMQSLGHSADFRGEGTLLIDGTVVVRKTAAGRVEIESVGVPGTGGGPAARMGGTFYAVKKTIYDGLAVVAGA